MTNTSGWCYSL